MKYELQLKKMNSKYKKIQEIFIYLKFIFLY